MPTQVCAQGAVTGNLFHVVADSVFGMVGCGGCRDRLLALRFFGDRKADIPRPLSGQQQTSYVRCGFDCLWPISVIHSTPLASGSITPLALLYDILQASGL